MKRKSLKFEKKTILLWAIMVFCLSGCGPREIPALTEYIDAKGLPCELTIHRSTYSSKDKRPVIKILWDGKKVIEGGMPIDQRPIDKALSFVQIKTSPGVHFLEMYCDDGRYQKRKLVLREGERRDVLLFALDSNGKEVVLELLELGERL